MRPSLRIISRILLFIEALTLGVATADAERMSPLPAPRITLPQSWEQWLTERPTTRSSLVGLLGGLPAQRMRPQAAIVFREEREGYTLEKFHLVGKDGEEIPGYLLLPSPLPSKVPAILYCHAHGRKYHIGKEEMLLSSPLPVAPGPTLARLGYAVLGIDAPCFGERNGRTVSGSPDRDSEGEWTAAKLELWAGRSLWARILRDDLLALDYLMARSEVDPSRVGVTGMSMGSTRAWWLMALDTRLRAAVCVACLTRYEDLVASGGLSAHGIYYFVPSLAASMDTESIIALAAPRPVLFLSGERDRGSPLSGIRTIEAKVGKLYEAAGVGAAFKSVTYPNTGHVYNADMWDRMLEWMNFHVKGTEETVR